LESKASALATPSHLDQSRPNLKVWTPTRLNLMAVRLKLLPQGFFRILRESHDSYNTTKIDVAHQASPSGGTQPDRD